MKRIIVTIAVALASLALASPAQAATPSHSSGDIDSFILALPESVVMGSTRRQLHSMGDDVCKALAVASVARIGVEMVTRGIPAEDAGQIIGASASNLCPRHLSKVTAFVDAHS